MVIDEAEAKIINYIFDSYLSDMPLYLIKQKTEKMGYDRAGKMAIERILAHPVYAGLQKVEAFKELPGVLFPALHEPIIDITTWKMVQSKLQKPDKVRSIIDDDLPLRGVLKCHCGNPLTGAPSRGKSGKYFFYYKCRHSKHNNISAIKAHLQLSEALQLMSIPPNIVKNMRVDCRKSMEKEFKIRQEQIVIHAEQKKDVEAKMLILEEKWLTNQVTEDTYRRWYATYNDNLLNCKGTIERLSKDQSEAYKILDRNLHQLSNLQQVYHHANTIQKLQLINMVFDCNLYYENGSYRTPTMMSLFDHNYLKMSNLRCLIYKKKRDNISIIPHSGR